MPEHGDASRYLQTGLGVAVVFVVIIAIASLTYTVQVGVHSAVGHHPSKPTTTGGASTTAPGTPTTSSAAPAYQVLVEPQAGMGQIYALTGQAKKSIDMTMYELADQTEEQALVAAAKRGVVVKVLLDKDYNGGTVNQAAYSYLKANGVQVNWAPANTIYHQKSIEFDGSLAMVGTGNLASKYYATSRDYWVGDTNPDDVSAIVTTFERDFTSPTLTSGTGGGNVLWSPGAEAPMVALINSATTSVWFESEELSDTAIINALAGDAHRGVKCEIVMTDSPSWSAAFATLRTAGCAVHLYPNSANSLYIHAKAIVVDAGTSNAHLFVGSQNASAGSLQYNRELGLVLTSQTAPSVLSGISSAFTSDFEGAPQT